MLVMLIIFMVITPMLSKGVSVDLVKTKNPIAMQDADKEDAVLVAVTRDGRVYLGVRPRRNSGRVARQGEGPADQAGWTRPVLSRAIRAPVMKRWWKWWTTCAPPAWTTLGLLTELDPKAAKARGLKPRQRSGELGGPAAGSCVGERQIPPSPGKSLKEIYYVNGSWR